MLPSGPAQNSPELQVLLVFGGVLLVGASRGRAGLHTAARYWWMKAPSLGAEPRRLSLRMFAFTCMITTPALKKAAIFYSKLVIATGL